MPTRRAALASLLALPFAASATAAPVPSATQKELEALWADLAKDEVPATMALLKLSAKPKDVVPFLREKLKPLTIDEKRVRTLLADLEGDKEDARKAAIEELEYYDPRLAIELPALFDIVTTHTGRAYMVGLLSGDRLTERLLEQNAPITLSQHGGKNGEEVYYNFRQGGSWWAEHRVGQINATVHGNRRKYWTRAVRAITLLEHIGTPEAAAVLKTLATGHADAQPTKAAKDALARLEKAK